MARFFFCFFFGGGGGVGVGCVVAWGGAFTKGKSNFCHVIQYNLLLTVDSDKK